MINYITLFLCSSFWVLYARIGDRTGCFWSRDPTRPPLPETTSNLFYIYIIYIIRPPMQ